MGVLFVTHDLGVVAEIADRIVVMYAGKVMERGDVLDIFDHPGHPYTQQLLECLPEFGGTGRRDTGDAPRPARPAGRLPVRAPLRVRRGGVPHRRAAGGDRGRARVRRSPASTTDRAVTPR